MNSKVALLSISKLRARLFDHYPTLKTKSTAVSSMGVFLIVSLLLLLLSSTYLTHFTLEPAQ